MASVSKSVITHKGIFYTRISTNLSLDAPVILFIHGIGESSLCFKEALLHSNLLGLGTLIMPDLPGFGASIHASVSNYEDYISIATDNLLCLIGEVAINHNPLILISHSAGNVIALNLLPQLKNHLIAYVDMDGIYAAEPWRYSSQVHRYASADIFYSQAYNNLLTEIQTAPNESLLRYYSSFVRCYPEAFYQYAKATQKFLIHQKYYLNFVKGKHLFIASKKINGLLLNQLETSDIKVIQLSCLGHWVMLEEPQKVYDLIVHWITNINIPIDTDQCCYPYEWNH